MAEWVIDASIVIRRLVPGEPLRNKAQKLLRDAVLQKVVLIAPPLIEYELESELQRRLYSRQANSVLTDKALNTFYAIGIQIVTHPEIVRRAREIARQYRQERIYDALYAALTEIRACEFWTADRRFYEAVKTGLPYVNYLADYA